MSDDNGDLWARIDAREEALQKARVAAAERAKREGGLQYRLTEERERRRRNAKPPRKFPKMPSGHAVLYEDVLPEPRRDDDDNPPGPIPFG